MNLLSLCTGYGGLDMATVGVLGGAVRWVSDIEPGPCALLACRYPGVPNLGDLTKVDWSSLGRVDVVTAGYPCQPFSHAGKRKGTKDERHIWPYIAEAVRVLRPRWVVLENVAGHRSMGFGDVLGDLAEARYDVRWCSVRASDVGAPHGRERLFIVAAAGDSDGVGGEGWASAGQSWEAGFAPGLAADSADVGREWGGEAWGRRAGLADGGRVAADSDVSGSQGAESAGRRVVPDRGAAADSDRDPVRPQSEPVAGRCGPAVSGFAGPDFAADSVGGGCGGDARTSGRVEVRRAAAAGGRAVDWREYGPAVRRWERVLGRPAPYPTEVGPRGGQRLSARLVEWMMGLPAGWVTDVPGLSRSRQLKVLGNGVVPQQASYALRLLLECEEGQ